MGWYTEAGLTNQITSISADAKGDIELYAKWERKKVLDKEDLNFSLASIEYTGQENQLFITTDVQGCGMITTHYYSDVYYSTEVSSPINAGTYYVLAIAEEGDEYAAARIELGALEVLKAGQKKPEGLNVSDETQCSASDGKIIRTNSKMEFKNMNSDAEYQVCDEDETVSLAPGTYYVRYAETQNLRASDAAEVAIAKAEHSWGKAEVTIQPTCKEAGTITYACVICKSIKEEELAALGHNYAVEWTIDREATCTESGSKSHHCVNLGCEEKSSVTELKAFGHDWDEGETVVEATCEEVGVMKYECKACKEAREEGLAALGHNYASEWTIDKEATCTESGSKSYHCVNLGCEEKSSVTELKALGHDWNEGKITIQPTYTSKGSITFNCDTCGILRIEESAKKVLINIPVIYKLDGGKNNAKNPKQINALSNITLKNPTRAGYHFMGWYIDSCFKTKVTKISNYTKDTLNLYAKWSKITLKKPTIKKCNNLKPYNIKISFTKVNGADGYEVLYSTNPKFKKVKKIYLNNTNQMIRIGKEAVCYVKVRAYSIDSSGKRVYGKYSAIKKVTVRK